MRRHSLRLGPSNDCAIRERIAYPRLCVVPRTGEVSNVGLASPRPRLPPVPVCVQDCDSG